MNILLTSAGRRTYMVKYFKNVLKGKGKVFASNSIETNTLHEADNYVITPQIYDENYIGFLLDYCKKENIQAIISLFDIDLPILSRNRELFEKEGIKLVISDYKVTTICNDKWSTYEFLCRIGVKQTPSFISKEKAIEAINEGSVSYPLYIKPRWGMGSIGIYKVDNEDELNVLYNKLYKEIFNTYLKFESEFDRESCIIIQQSIIGQEYGIEILNDLEGNYVATFAKRKISMRAGETDIAETVNPFQFEETAKIISSNLKHIGNLDVDCFVTDNGDLYVLEMNCRFGGQYPFTHNSGVDEPQQIINWLEGKGTDMSLLNQRDGVKSCKELVPVIIK